MAQTARQRLSHAERRAQLLRCAVTDAAKVGLGRLTHAGVARESGVAVPTVFAYFGNRTALVEATVEDVKRFYLELAAYWHRPEVPARAAIEGHIRAYYDSIHSELDYAQVWLEWCTAVRNEFGIWSSFIDYYERIVELLASSVRRGQKQGTIGKSVNAVDAARQLVSCGVTVTQLYFMQRDKREITRYINCTLRLVLGDEPARDASGQA
jgi:AcrR family transcriptional regulator